MLAVKPDAPRKMSFSRSGLLTDKQQDGRSLKLVECLPWTQSYSCVVRLEIPRDVDDDNSLVTPDEEQQLQQLNALVMKEVLPPVLNHELG